MMIGRSQEREEAKGAGKRCNMGQAVPEMDPRLPITSSRWKLNPQGPEHPQFTVPLRRMGKKRKGKCVSVTTGTTPVCEAVVLNPNFGDHL